MKFLDHRLVHLQIIVITGFSIDEVLATFQTLTKYTVKCPAEDLKRKKMKTTLMMLTMLVMVSGCTSVNSQPDSSYDRQNAAAEKAQRQLDKE